MQQLQQQLQRLMVIQVLFTLKERVAVVDYLQEVFVQ